MVNGDKILTKGASTLNRDKMINQLDGSLWDVIVIGGGATGLGIAVDAQTRGYRTLLLEQYDFAKGTSSRSTKLVHGGVRYLKQGNIALVTEALRERGLMRRNAPHLVQDLAFVVPRYKWWEGPFYGIGLRLYDRLAGKLNIARSQRLTRRETIRRIPNIEPDRLLGGTVYHDAQFDDARMAVTLARTAEEHGAVVLNYMPVTGLIKTHELVEGVEAVDSESNRSYHLRSRVVINAAGIFSDAIRAMDDSASEKLLTTSQGVHLVLDRSFLSSDTAIMVPQTDDGRVLFVIPWYDRVLVGTTDTEMSTPSIEPCALNEEINFILRNAARYLSHAPERADILSIFAGQRPLVRSSGGTVQSKAISRDHHVVIDDSGLVTIIGGKWTTYRKMAQDTVNEAAHIGELEAQPCVTEGLALHGWAHDHDPVMSEKTEFRVYGSEAAALQNIIDTEPECSRLLHPRLPYLYGHVIWAIRYEMARTIEDVLARRTRSLLLDARASIESTSGVAGMMARELGKDSAWETDQTDQFIALAEGYLP